MQETPLTTPEESSRVVPDGRRVQLVSSAIGVLGLVGGAGVVGEVFVGRSPWLLAAAVAGPSLGVLLIGWQTLDASRRALIRTSARVGLAAGVAGLAAYDLVRWAVVWILGSTVNPFEAFPVFGELLVGANHSNGVLFAAGAAYHVFNGIGFAVFFALLVGPRGVRAGVAWAIMLELATLAIYPGWLDVRAMREFTIVSACGHLAYGATIGWTTTRWLGRP